MFDTDREVTLVMDEKYKVRVVYGQNPTLAELKKMFDYVSNYRCEDAAPVNFERTELVAAVPRVGEGDAELQLTTLNAFRNNGQRCFVYEAAEEDLRAKRFRPAVFEELIAMAKQYPEPAGYTALGSALFEGARPMWAPDFQRWRKKMHIGTYGITFAEAKDGQTMIDSNLHLRLLGGRDWCKDEEELFLVVAL